MEHIIEAILSYVRAKFTGKITLHLHDGVVKKITKESSIKF